MYYFGLFCSLVFYSSKLFYEDFFNVVQIFRLQVSGKPECQNQHDLNVVIKYFMSSGYSFIQQIIEKLLFAR